MIPKGGLKNDFSELRIEFSMPMGDESAFHRCCTAIYLRPKRSKFSKNSGTTNT